MQEVQKCRSLLSGWLTVSSRAMHDDTPFPADGEAAWNELLFEAAVHRSALQNGARVFLADVERAAAV